MLLLFRGLGYNIVVLHLRDRQVQLVSGFNVCNLLKQVHQLRQIEEFTEPGPRPVAGAFRCQLQSRYRFTEPAGPAVKMGHVQLLQPVILEIPLHGVKLRHGVADRSAGGEYHAPVAGKLVHVAALGKHVAGFLGIRCRKAGNIAHFGKQEQVFVGVGLVNKQPVNAQLLEGYNIVFSAVCLELLQLGFQGLPGSLQLFNGEAFASAQLYLGNSVCNLIDLFLQ